MAAAMQPGRRARGDDAHGFADLVHYAKLHFVVIRERLGGGVAQIAVPRNAASLTLGWRWLGTLPEIALGHFRGVDGARFHGSVWLLAATICESCQPSGSKCVGSGFRTLPTSAF